MHCQLAGKGNGLASEPIRSVSGLFNSNVRRGLQAKIILFLPGAALNVSERNAITPPRLAVYLAYNQRHSAKHNLPYQT